MATNTLSSVKSTQIDNPSMASYTPRTVFFGAARWWNGFYAISGWVRDSGGTPQQRKVALSIFPHHTPVAFTISDPNNVGNNYFFNGLQQLNDGNETYIITVHNLDLATTPRIKDNRVPV